jgi:hypothetical protein
MTLLPHARCLLLVYLVACSTPPTRLRVPITDGHRGEETLTHSDAPLSPDSSPPSSSAVVELVEASCDGTTLVIQLRIWPGWAIVPLSGAQGTGLVLRVDPPAGLTTDVTESAPRSVQFEDGALVQAHLKTVLLRVGVDTAGAAAMTGRVIVVAFNAEKMLLPDSVRFRAQSAK